LAEAVAWANNPTSFCFQGVCFTNPSICVVLCLCVQTHTRRHAHAHARARTHTQIFVLVQRLACSHTSPALQSHTRIHTHIHTNILACSVPHAVTHCQPCNCDGFSGDYAERDGGNSHEQVRAEPP
jgi:hypothetical protein